MKTNELGFIGGGRVTRILLQAFSAENETFKSAVVFDTNPDVLTALKTQYPMITIAETLEEAAKQPTVFIALHPPVIMETLDKIADVITEGAFVISLAPKITIEKIATRLMTKNIARLIPNATSYINKGYNPVAFHPEIMKFDKKEIKGLLNILGKTFVTDEAKLECYAIASAMLPTYFWFQFQEIEKIAQQTGLTPEEASKTVKASLKKAIATYYNSGLTPAEVMDLIPIKPIGEHEGEIKEIYQTKLMGLFGKIKP